MLWLRKLWRNGFLMYKHVMPIFLLLLMYFITHIKWDVIISSSLRLLLKVWIWHRCQNRKLCSPWWRAIIFFKKVHIKTQSQKKNILVIFILLLYNALYYCKSEESNLFDKIVIKRNLKRTLCLDSAWIKLTWMNRNWTDKLQVTLLSDYIPRKKL